ncbi:hypothetical protein [Embleya sp. NBC_00896]|uniref:hypothetical protein n=1 Tax=Embleya sp. NBC_00896 TaxID=2975961 RepID=UPI00386404EE|nr:hypothetical protein OG928_25640 [Embleya sp. NBC_00896]
MEQDWTLRFTAPADGPAGQTVAPATPHEQVSSAPVFAVGDCVRREQTRWRDGGKVIGMRITEVGHLYTIRRWSDKALYDATTAELVPDPIMYPIRPV